jgi:hypothetical protein
MLNLPASIMTLLEPFRPIFHQSTWNKVQVLLVGAVLAPGKRTVTAALHAVGLSQEKGFTKYHQVLNRAVWSPRQMSQILLMLSQSLPLRQTAWYHKQVPIFADALAWIRLGAADIELNGVLAISRCAGRAEVPRLHNPERMLALYPMK